MAPEIFLGPPDTTRRVRPLLGHPIVPRCLCPVQPFSISPGRPNAALEGKLTPPLSRNLEQSSIQRLDWTIDQIDRLSIEIDSMPRGTGHAAAMELQRCCSRSSHGDSTPYIGLGRAVHRLHISSYNRQFTKDRRITRCQVTAIPSTLPQRWQTQANHLGTRTLP